MGIYHFSADIIGRSSGRSSVGASAYRSGEKLHSHAAGSAAYRSGDKLREEDGVIVHDYTRKKGVKHSEIMLPKDAPPEYKDRETLWNAIENRSRRIDAQLAREIVVALQIEFELQEQIELLREYIRENFTDKGMCADFAIHDKGDGNPHAHIMLTLRDVSPNGFGNINRDWSQTAELVKWRENWAEVNNRKFEEKGLDERIDHRTLKAQGIDREPMIHMGHKATALERKGIKTERGDYNREIKRRNAERVRESAEITTNINNDKSAPKNNRDEAERSTHIATLQGLRDLEQYLKAKKATEIVEEMQKRQAERQTIAQQLSELREYYFELAKEQKTLKIERNNDENFFFQLAHRPDDIKEFAKNIEHLQRHPKDLQENRQKLGFWDWKQKKEKDEEIVQAKQELAKAQEFFTNHFHMTPNQAPQEIRRIQKKIDALKDSIAAKTARIDEISKQQAAIELQYRAQKLLTNTRPDRQQIERLLEKMTTPPKSVRDRLIYGEIIHHLNTIGNTAFQKVIDTLPAPQAKILVKRREQDKAKELKKIHEQSKSREIDRTR